VFQLDLTFLKSLQDLLESDSKVSGAEKYFKTKIQRISEEISHITSRLEHELFLPASSKKRLLERIFSLKKMRKNIREIFKDEPRDS